MTKRKATKETRPSVCVACGCEAAGYNYEAPSCGSCKTFFRRTVVEEKVYKKCLKIDVCAQIESIRQCRACRFQRCVRGGMNARMISTLPNPDANAVLRRFYQDDTLNNNGPSTSTADSNLRETAVLQNEESLFHKKNQTVPSQTSDSRTDGPLALARTRSPLRRSSSMDSQEVPDDPVTNHKPRDMRLVPNPFQLENRLERMMQNLLRIEDAHHKLRISTYLPIPTTGLSMDEFAFVPSKLGCNFEKMCAQAYEPLSIQLFPEELYIKHRICIDFTQFDYTTRKLWVFQDQVYAIEFIKALPIFQLLEDTSKRVLAASALTCSSFTTAYFSHSQKSDRSCYPDGSVMTWSREMEDDSPDSTRFHTALIASMRQLHLDKREYTLLKMILVCNPLLSGLSTHDVTLLQHEKERYTKTLLSYVFARHGVIEGPALFAKLLSIVDLAIVLTTWQKSQHILIMAMGLHKHRSPLIEDIFHSH